MRSAIPSPLSRQPDHQHLQFMSNTPRLTAHLVVIILSGICACLSTTAAAFTFTPSHIYTTNYFSLDIMEYDSSGNFIDFRNPAFQAGK